jgi:excinuclease ABC subunit C
MSDPTAPPPDPGHPPELLAQVAALPGLPGVPLLRRGRRGALRGQGAQPEARVSSYFSKNHGGTRIGHMVGKIARLETTVVRSEAEALLLENNLIKTLAPSTTSCFGTTRATLPQDHRQAARPPRPRPGAPTGGLRAWPTTAAPPTSATATCPYPSAWAVKETIQLLQKVFRLRTCEDTVFANRTRPACCTRSSAAAPCVA